jgi:signal transduction histidine kinase
LAKPRTDPPRRGDRRGGVRYDYRVGFEQELRDYLEGSAQGREAAATPRSVRVIDEHELHRHLIERLRLQGVALDPEEVKRRFAWADKLSMLARFLESWPGLSTEGAAAMVFARRVVDAAIRTIDAETDAVDRLELDRVLWSFARHEHTVDRYALENQLTRRELEPPRVVATELARVFLRLRGKDAIRWLLTCELVQCAGAFDPWRTSADLLMEAAESGIDGVLIDDLPYFSHSLISLERLESYSVLRGGGHWPGPTLRYEVEPAMRDLVEAVLEPGPWHTAVRALLDDERATVIPGMTASSAEATIEQTKLIAHEVRNALIPVRHDLDALRGSGLEVAQRQRIDDARGGVVRVLEFVEDMVQASELITEAAVRCEIATVVDDALAWSDRAQRVVKLIPADAGAFVVPRTRLALAVANVVGNALQATVADQPVRLSVVRSATNLRIIVDDGGPGVPVEHRQRVFLEGVTLRGAGSGFGLAFARRVVEDAVHGRIWCEDSDLGGARFVIEIPEPSPA